MSDDGTRGHASKKNGDPQQSMPPDNDNGTTKAGIGIYLTEIVLAGAVGTGIWLSGEHLASHGYEKSGSSLVCIAFITYFATVPITALKFWPKPKLIWSVFVTFSIVSAVLFLLISQSKSELRPPAEVADFSVQAILGMSAEPGQSPENDLPLYWFLGDVSPRAAYPVYYLMCVELTSIRSTPTRLRAFKMQTKHQILDGGMRERLIQNMGLFTGWR